MDERSTPTSTSTTDVYLHLDESGHAYRYRATAAGGRYTAYLEPGLAIEALDLDPVARRL